MSTTAPAAAAASAASNAAPDAGGSGASQSDDAILGITPDNGAAEGTQPAATQDVSTTHAATAAEGTSAATAAQQTQQATQQAAQAQAQQPASLDVLKELFQDAKYGKAAQSAYDRLAKFGEAFPDVATAFEYSKLFPDLDTAKAASTGWQAFETLNGQLLSGDPAQFKQVLSGYVKDSPDAAASFIENFPAMIRELQPAAWEKMQGDATELALRGFAQQAAQISGDEGRSLVEAVETVYKAAYGREIGSRAPAAQTPREKQLQQQLDGMKAQQSSDLQSRESAARQTINVKWMETGADEIKRLIAKPLDDAKATDWTRNALTNSIARATLAALEQNTALKFQLDQMFKTAKGNFDPAFQTKAVGLVMNHFKRVVAQVAAKELEGWTTQTIQSATDSANRTATNAGRTDIAGSGRPPRTNGRPLTKSDIDYSKMDDSAILDA